jgi:hypothetical protein
MQIFDSADDEDEEKDEKAVVCPSKHAKWYKKRIC